MKKIRTTSATWWKTNIIGLTTLVILIATTRKIQNIYSLLSSISATKALDNEEQRRNYCLCSARAAAELLSQVGNS